MEEITYSMGSCFSYQSRGKRDSVCILLYFLACMEASDEDEATYLEPEVSGVAVTASRL